jgi:manganese/zinc/iron transport system substrate-binding protein
MIKVKGALFIIAIIMMFMLIGCSRSRLNQNYDISKLNVVSTTTMLTDLSKIIGGEHVSVIGLMGPGIDPHLYQASAGDVSIMQESDVIVYNGLRLEGKMGDIFESMSNQGHKVICI